MPINNSLMFPTIWFETLGEALKCVHVTHEGLIPRSHYDAKEVLRFWSHSSDCMPICFSILCSLRFLMRSLKSSSSCLCIFSSGGKISLFRFTMYSSKYSAWFDIQNIATGNDRYTIICLKQ